MSMKNRCHLSKASLGKTFQLKLAVLMTATVSVGNSKGQNLAKVSRLPSLSRESTGKTRMSVSFRSVALRRGQLLPMKAGGGVKVMITVLNLFCYRHETIVCLCLTSLCTLCARRISGCPDMKSRESTGKCFPVFSLCSADTFREGNGLSSPTSCT